MESGVASSVPVRRVRDRLSDAKIKAWLKTERTAGQKLPDGAGLYLVSQRSGNAAWQVRFPPTPAQVEAAEQRGAKFPRQAQTISLGIYGEVSLSEAREERDRLRKLGSGGLNPVVEHKIAIAQAVTSSDITFESVAAEWLAKERPSWSTVHFAKSARALERDVYPSIGALPVPRISVVMVSAVIDRVQKRGAIETAQKLLQHTRSIFRFAQAKGLRADNPAEPVTELLQKAPPTTGHPALLTWPELGDILRRAEVCNVSPAVRLCHRLIAYTAVRVENAVSARWEHFNLDAVPATWSVPRSAMKGDLEAKAGGVPHTVFLHPTLVEHLRRWRTAQSAKATFLFPGNQGRDYISRDTVSKLLRETLELRDKHSPHGWRSAFSTRLKEDTDIDGDLIEMSLDHDVKTSVEKAYDRGERLAKRAPVFQWWGDQLAAAERGDEVVPTPAAPA